MKGMGKLLAYFIKIMELAIIIVAILVAFFDITEFQLETNSAKAEREVRVISEAILAHPDLTVDSNGYPLRAVFDEEKIEGFHKRSTIPNLKYPDDIFVKFSYRNYEIGESDLEDESSVHTEFPAAIKVKDSEEVKPITIDVYVGDILGP